MPRKIAGSEIRTIELLMDASRAPIVVFDSATHLYRGRSKFIRLRRRAVTAAAWSFDAMVGGVSSRSVVNALPSFLRCRRGRLPIDGGEAVPVPTFTAKAQRRTRMWEWAFDRLRVTPPADRARL